MKVNGQSYRTIWTTADQRSVRIINQTLLPHQFVIEDLQTAEQAASAIRDMLVRGAPLIGATAAYGFALGMMHDASDSALDDYSRLLLATRPTAVNLRWALERCRNRVGPLPRAERVAGARALAAEICDEDVHICERIGHFGLQLLRELAAKKNGRSPVNVLTHCNAGWLATVDWGTALAPVYKAHNANIPVHVWVDETRPRNQGASLTAWELAAHGVPHTVIVDNAGGHLMQHGLVDLCIVGTDRTTACGDVCNKIGTYLKALAAHDNGVPFFVALPSPSIDWRSGNGLADIPIEQRDSSEVRSVTGLTRDGKLEEVTIVPEGSNIRNDAFDVTPAKYVTGFITERGISAANRDSLAELFPKTGRG